SYSTTGGKGNRGGDCMWIEDPSSQWERVSPMAGGCLFPFSPWGEGGPKGRMRGQACCSAPAAPSSRCRDLLPEGRRGRRHLSKSICDCPVPCWGRCRQAERVLNMQRKPGGTNREYVPIIRHDDSPFQCRGPAHLPRPTG